ncbi:MAG TPA: MgtC/SapB family protein [Candidatus Latescibacteria bacterium]|nr:MgtC/SapB family protein [Candidatus Latescibacterota bacterium]
MDTVWGFLSSLGEPAARLTLAVLASSVIGWEREIGGHPAGLRTNIMVALGAAIFTLLSQDIVAKGTGDPTRVIAGVAQGIGFLGAGTIFLDANRIKGLTSAATIWVMGGLGIAWGAGSYPTAILGTLAAFVVLRTIKRLELVTAEKLRNRADRRDTL